MFATRYQSLASRGLLLVRVENLILWLTSWQCTCAPRLPPLEQYSTDDIVTSLWYELTYVCACMELRNYGTYLAR